MRRGLCEQAAAPFGMTLADPKVAVPLDELTIRRDADEDRRHEPDRVQTRLTVAQLESLPEFRYE